MVEVRAEETDLVPEYHEDAIVEELEALFECPQAADLSHEQKREHIEYLFEKWGGVDAAGEPRAAGVGDRARGR